MIYSKKQREITLIQKRRLEAEVGLLSKFNPVGLRKVQIDGLKSAIEDLDLELSQYNRRQND